MHFVDNVLIAPLLTHALSVDSSHAARGRRAWPRPKHRHCTLPGTGDTFRLQEQQLSEAHRASQRSDIIISFNAPVGTVLTYHVAPEWVTIEGAYDNWIATRQPPLFGTEPDARVWALAQEAG
ncbi:MAG TPA: hypothetical protein VIJ23_09155, partial [Mycobacterium sp.]